MSLLFAFTLFVTCALFGVGIYCWLCRFSERTPNDVPPFLQKIDLEVLYGTFHPDAEAVFKESNTAEEFKKIQWKRLHLAIHFCKLLSSNSRVIQGLTRYQRKRNWDALGPDLQPMVSELRFACMQCRMASLVILLRLQWWLLKMSLLPWLPAPTFKKLLPIGSSDMITFYGEVVAKIEQFSLIFGNDYHNRLMQAL